MYALTQTPPDFKAEAWGERMDRNRNRLLAEDAAARATKTLLGRVIQHPVADDSAFYQIIKVNKRTVVVRHCINVGDDYIFRGWGTGDVSIPLKEAQRYL